MLTQYEISCFRVISYVINTHESLTKDEKKFAANWICSLHIQARKKFDENKLLLFLTYTNKEGICRFALTYNKKLDALIRERNKTGILNFLSDISEKYFVELYDNPSLSEDDRLTIERKAAIEYVGHKLLLDTILQKLKECELVSTGSQTTNSCLTVVSLARDCQDNVCVEDAKQAGCSETDALFLKHDKCPQRVYTAEGVFETEPLLKQLATGQTTLSSGVRSALEKKFRKELAMYKRHLQV